MLHPITFSVPEEKIPKTFAEKIRLISELIPGKIETYKYSTEKDYYEQYQESYFALTTKKGGWDCMRHYEIIMNGCLPTFPDIEKCPPKTMALLPKDLIHKSNELYKSSPDITSVKFQEEYNLLRGLFLNHLKENLTTEKMAEYVLEKSSAGSAKKILYLSGELTPDYLRCVTLHGFKKKFGKMCHDHPKVPHIYKEQTIDYGKLYGKGFTYTNLLDPSDRDDSLDLSLFDDIAHKKYDIVIYGSFHRGLPHYYYVLQFYKPSEIILLCGEDEHQCSYNFVLGNGHHAFVRELNP